MAVADLTPGILDVKARQGDTITLVCTFNIDLTGYTDWVATIQPVDLSETDAVLFTVDSSQQVSSIIKLTYLTDTAWLKARWDLEVTDPNGDPFYILAGDILLERAARALEAP